MAIILALCVSASFGSGDFLSGLAGRRTTTPLVVSVSQLFGLLGVGIYLAATDRSIAGGRDLLLGVLAGATLAVGISGLVRGLSIGRMSVVAPTAAATGACVGVFYGLITGERPVWYALLGVVLAILAVVMIAKVAETEDQQASPARLARTEVAGRAREVGLGALAGTFLGLTQVFFSETSADSGLWPIAATRLTTGILIGIVVLGGIRKTMPSDPGKTGWALILGYGLLDALGACLFIEALRRGFVSLVAPVVSLYPATTILLARVILKERMNSGQIVGLALAAAGILLIALGSGTEAEAAAEAAAVVSRP